jgi:glycosyltransferase involved in cell wall biosynthesis
LRKERSFGVFGVSRKFPAGLRQVVFFFKTFFLARKSDLIYTTDLYSPGYASTICSKILKKKFVVRFAGDSAWETARGAGETKDGIIDFQEKKQIGSAEKKKRKRAKILKSADAVVAVSGFMKDLALRIGVREEKIFVIYNAVDFFEERPRWQDPERPVLVFAGRLTSWKGVGAVLRVVKRLRKEFPDMFFDVLGGGPEFETLKKMSANLGIAGCVNFRGNVSEEESHSYFARSSVFVLNSGYEGFSHAILNAMSVGVPVAVSDIGGNPELVESGVNGFLVEYNNEDAWYEAVKSLLRDKYLRSKFSDLGRKTAAKFRWEDVINKTAEVLNLAFDNAKVEIEK